MSAARTDPTAGVSYLLRQHLLPLLLYQLRPLVQEHLLHEGCLGLAAQEAGPCWTGSGDHAAGARGHGGLHGARGPGKPDRMLLLEGQEEKRMQPLHM